MTTLLLTASVTAVGLSLAVALKMIWLYLS
jgi:hypothetical protein